jgi:Tfp pilus assembly PilM family ATPase
MNPRFGQALRRIGGGLSAGGAYPIGLQLGRDSLSLVQMEKTAAGPPAFRAAAALDYECAREEMLSNPLRLKALLKRAFAQQPFRGKRVVACMPEDQVKIALVNFAVAEGQSDAEAIVRELGERVKGNSAGTILDFILVRPEGHPGQQKEAIVAMAAREQVTAYLDLLAGAGLQVVALDIGPMALTRVVSWIAMPQVESPANLLLINFGSVGSYLTVVWGRRLMLDRAIEFSEQRLLAKAQMLLEMPGHEAKRLLVEHGFATADATAEAIDLSRTLREVLRPEFAALAAEVSKTMIYTASKTRGRAVDKIYVMGDITRYRGIGELLGELLSMPVEVLDPFAIFAHRLNDASLAKLLPRSRAAVATGLALRNVKIAWPNLT